MIAVLHRRFEIMLVPPLFFTSLLVDIIVKMKGALFYTISNSREVKYKEGANKVIIVSGGTEDAGFVLKSGKVGCVNCVSHVYIGIAYPGENE